MFIDEARIAGQLTHPNICRIYELGRVGGDHYIAMQFLWGRDLLKVMNRYKRAGLLIPPPMAVFIAAHACGALHYAHFKCDVQGNPLHIIHRDVSPQNIIVGYSGQAKLIDFGVARAASQSQKTQAGILKGKFGYMSPEMIRGLPVDHRSDVFAMGICLHEALTGSRLFYGETDFATLELVRDAKIAPPSAKVPSISPELDAIVLKALSRDADERYQTANELAAALDEYLERHHPGYGEADVSASMREAFAHELSREKLRLDAFAQMLERGELIRGAALPALPNDPPPSGERSAISSEQPLPDRPGEKLGSAPAPFNAQPEAHAYGTPAEARALGQPGAAQLGGQSHGDAPDHEDELSEEQTQIFFSAAELNEIRELGALSPLTPKRAPAPSEVIMRSSSGFTTPPPMMPAPTFAALTPSGTYPRRFDEQGQASPEVAPSHGRFGQTQPISGYEGPLRDSSAARIHRDRGTVRSSLLALGALVIAGIGYAAVSLSGGRGTGVLEIGSVGDPDALVRVDGVVRGNPPLNVEGLLPGPHNVEIEARGYEVTRAEVSVGAGATRAVNLVLSKRNRPSIDPLSRSNAAPPKEQEAPAPEPARSSVTAAEKPSTQEAGNKLNAHPALVRAKNAEPAEVPAGQVLLARGPARLDGSAATRASAGHPESQLPAEPEPSDTPPATGETQVGESIDENAAAAGEGILLISTVPWSRVIIDGSDTGRDTPVRALRVNAGDHLIVLRTPEGEEHNVNVSVAAGRTVRIIRRF
jgi:hypothetical protein